MYHNSISFIIVSGNGEIQKAVENTVPPKDCSYSFSTVSSISGADIKLDTAYIFDCTDGIIPDTGNIGCEAAAAVFSAGSKELTDHSAVSAFGDIWVMPDGKYDGDLLRMYFSRFAARMESSAGSRSELEIILNCIPFGVLIESTDGTVMNKNILFDEYFPEFYDIAGKPSEEWKKSLNVTNIPDIMQKEVTVRYGDNERMLLVEEELLTDALRHIKGRIITITDVTEERANFKNSEMRANTDFLTNLHNRRNFEQHIKTACKDKDFTLIMVDLDNFKQVNDTLGHDAGDKALVVTADILKECFENDFVARLGGDEFIIAATGQDTGIIKQKALKTLEKMRSAEEKYKELEKVTASIGIAFSSTVSQEYRGNADMLMRFADEQLYKAKNSGKNCCYIYGE